MRRAALSQWDTDPQGTYQKTDIERKETAQRKASPFPPIKTVSFQLKRERKEGRMKEKEEEKEIQPQLHG